MRLLDEGGGNRVLEFKVNGTWRSVTGAVDFLSFAHADGSPLSVAERIDLYRQIATSPVGLLHPAADTWGEEVSSAVRPPGALDASTETSCVPRRRFVDRLRQGRLDSRYARAEGARLARPR